MQATLDPQPYQQDPPDEAYPAQMADAELSEEVDQLGMTSAQAESLVIALGQELQGKFAERVSQRSEVEQRWRDDLAQYNNQYAPDAAKALDERPYGSKVFVPITRRVCNVVEARLGDLLFPTDDRNFVVRESPEQDLTEAMALAQQLPDEAQVNAGGMTLSAEAVRAALRELREENSAKAQRMQRVIDDQLKEARYASVGRAVIHDAIKMGTGVVKAPYVLGRTKKLWRVSDGLAELQLVESFAPTAVRVDPWNYYPDLSVGELDAMDGHFERHPMNKAQLARLAEQPGFSRSALTRILTAGVDVSAGATENEAAQKEAAGTTNAQRQGYNLIEYTGPVDHDKLVAWGAKVPEDSLLVHQAIVWFHEGSGIVVKAVLSPMDTDEQPYSVFNWQRDTACVFGYGLPYELRDLQEAANATFRALMDNNGLSIGGQTVVNDQKIVPANGRWAIEPNKVWRLKDATQDVRNVFGFFQIPSLANELLGVFNSIKALADEIGGPTMAMQGSEAPSFLQAGATGAALAYTMANVWMRRAVRNYDDQVTVPMIGRFIDWNMQYHPDDSIKGDLQAVAQGTAALMEADGYAARIQVLAKMSAEAGVPLRRIIVQLRKIALAMRLDPEELLPDDAEVRAMEEEQAKNGPPPNPELERVKQRAMELEDRKAQRDHEMRLHEGEMQIRLAEIADRNKLSIDQARQRFGFEAIREAARLQREREAEATQVQMTNAELAARYQTGAGI